MSQQGWGAQIQPAPPSARPDLAAAAVRMPEANRRERDRERRATQEEEGTGVGTLGHVGLESWSGREGSVIG